MVAAYGLVIFKNDISPESVLLLALLDVFGFVLVEGEPLHRDRVNVLLLDLAFGAKVDVQVGQLQVLLLEEQLEQKVLLDVQHLVLVPLVLLEEHLVLLEVRKSLLDF